MGFRRTSISFLSRSDTIAGVLALPDAREPVPALVLCHGALDFKENLAELGDYLCSRGIASLALDMHGHGSSGGERCHVNIGDWVSDIGCSVDYLRTIPDIRKDAIGAFGFSSGGTAVLEAAVADGRLRCIITLDATVNNTMGLFDTGIVSFLDTLGRIKRLVTGKDLRLSMIKAFGKVPAVSDPEADRSWRENPRVLQMWSSVPFPGFSPSLRVDTIRRVHRIRVPVLVLHGEEDRIDDPASARMLHASLTCPKRLCIIPGNGHMGHRDRNRDAVFRLTGDWAVTHLV